MSNDYTITLNGFVKVQVCKFTVRLIIFAKSFILSQQMLLKFYNLVRNQIENLWKCNYGLLDDRSVNIGFHNL